MNRIVLVPLDGSPLGEEALDLSMEIARKISATVLLVRVVPLAWHVMPRFGDEATPPVQEHLETEAAAYLERIALRVTEGGLPVETLVVEGEIGETIAEVAEFRGASYIVMGTHGQTGAFRWPLGSVASRVLHLATCPLLLLPVREREAEKPASTAVRRILVPLDGSPEAEQVLPHARYLAELYGGELLLLRAFWVQPAFLPGAEIHRFEQDLGERPREAASAYLEQIVRELKVAGFRAHWAVAGEPAAEAILTYADTVHADLIAMTSHAREGLSRLVLGSVTDRVVRAAKCPVLVVRLAT